MRHALPHLLSEDDIQGAFQECLRGELYDVAFEPVTNDEAKEVVVRTPETTYFAIGIERMAVLMGAAGFTWMRRVDGCLFQPVLVGTR